MDKKGVQSWNVSFKCKSNDEVLNILEWLFSEDVVGVDIGMRARVNSDNSIEVNISLKCEDVLRFATLKRNIILKHCPKPNKNI